MTIFVSIASYCDVLLESTIESLFTNTIDPNSIYIGIVDQSAARNDRLLESTYAKNIRYLFIDFRDSRGVCWARSLASSLYQNEDWYLQIDSHTIFDQGWDQYLVTLAKSCHGVNDKIILSSYPNAFTIENGQFKKRPIRDRVVVHALDEESCFSEDSAFLQYRGVGINQTEPKLGGHLAAGSLFAKGNLFCEIPYDPFLYFKEEEQSLALRTFTHGWDIYHYSNSPIYHLYSNESDNNKKRDLHWDFSHQQQRVNNCCIQKNNESQIRLNKLLSETNELGIYGLGNVKTLDEYADEFGIDYRNRRISPLVYARRRCQAS